jgi:hypothetical protein
MSNNNNPYDLDEEQVRDKGTDNGVVRATVLDTLPETHAVRVNPRGDNAPVVAPVLTPTYGSQTLPDAGERVMLLYVAENTPICLGSIYLLDGEQPPNDKGGDLRIGNGEEFIRFNEDGGIDSSTDLGGSYDDEAAQDAVADLITGGANVSVTYDDTNNTLTVDTSALDEEEVEDTVSTLLTGGTSVSLNYDDANDTLTIDGFSGSHNDLTDVGADDHFNHATVAGTGSHNDLTDVGENDHHSRQHGNEDHDANYVDSAGDTMSGSLDMSGNGLNSVEDVNYSNSSNDFWRINDGSGGTNASPHTARFDDRDLRYYAGTGAGTVWQLNQDGSVEYPVGPVLISGDERITGTHEKTYSAEGTELPSSVLGDSRPPASRLPAGQTSAFLSSQNVFDDNIHAKSDGSGQLTYDEAVEYARERGGRLPTIEELEGLVTAGTGSGYDNNICWTQTQSGPEEVYVNYGKWSSFASDPRETRTTLSTDGSDTAVVRWVAEADQDGLPASVEQAGQSFFDGHLLTTQTNAENGMYVNIAESVNVLQNITVNSNSSIDVDKSGIYRVNFNVNFHRTGSGARNIMYSELELNGTRLSERTRSVCYIRNDGNGDEGDATGEAILDLNAGDTLRVFANEERGGESGNDIERASINVEHLG